MSSSTTQENRGTEQRSALATLWGWVVGFGRFWYDFVVGDDWRLAGTVVVSLLATWGLRAASVPAWWLVPVMVVAALYLTLVDKARRER